MKTFFLILLASLLLIGCIQTPADEKQQEKIIQKQEQISQQQISEKPVVSEQVNKAQENEIQKIQEKIKKPDDEEEHSTSS